MQVPTRAFRVPAHKRAVATDRIVLCPSREQEPDHQRRVAAVRLACITSLRRRCRWRGQPLPARGGSQRIAVALAQLVDEPRKDCRHRVARVELIGRELLQPGELCGAPRHGDTGARCSEQHGPSAATAEGSRACGRRGHVRQKSGTAALADGTGRMGQHVAHATLPCCARHRLRPSARETCSRRGRERSGSCATVVDLVGAILAGHLPDARALLRRRPWWRWRGGDW